ncbi:MAG: aminopeptidase N C-terminal domain-containing protein, partial [Bauldia sp.]
TAAARRGETLPPDHAFLDALGDIAEIEALDAAFRAQVLQLPGEADIAREVGRDVDPDAIAAARNGVRLALANRIGDTLADVHKRYAVARPFSPDSTAAGRRALANTTLDLMAGNRDPAAIERVVHRFEAADNMTDRLAALSILSAAALPQRIPALAAFHDRYRGDALVLDKWLALEATVPALETLDRVRSLLGDPDFSLSNPNRIRALVGAFASANQTQFNRADGAGYEFLASFVADLDGRNPQVAARLLISFRSWRALESGRRARAEQALKQIAAVPELSPDTRDIITRTLA